jgi:hypothetical protein
MSWHRITNLLVAFTALCSLSCGADPILARADDERAEEGGAVVRPPPGSAQPPGAGDPGQPTPGDPGQPPPGDGVQPPPGAPDQPQPGVPDDPAPVRPDDPGSEQAPLSAPQDGPTVTLRGEVRYADYRAGKVRVDVFDGDQLDRSKHPGVVGWADMSGPGSFELTVPVSTGNVWLSAFNDANGDGKPGHEDPTGFLEGNPVNLGDDALTGLVIQLTYNPRPEDQ